MKIIRCPVLSRQYEAIKEGKKRAFLLPFIDLGGEPMALPQFGCRELIVDGGAVLETIFTIDTLHKRVLSLRDLDSYEVEKLGFSFSYQIEGYLKGLGYSNEALDNPLGLLYIEFEIASDELVNYIKQREEAGIDRSVYGRV